MLTELLSFMRLTRGSDYGAHAVIELASCYGQGPLQCAEIAARQKIPEAYLDQLLSILRRVGIVRSLRGPHGGHELARDPRQLTLGEVVTALEGPVVPQEFVHSAETASPDWGSACAVRNAWHAAAEASQRVLDSITTRELVEQQVFIRTHREQLPPPAVGIRAPSEALLTTD